MAALALLATAAGLSAQGNYGTIDELKNLTDAAALPAYRTGVVEQVSSYDPTGGNEDGFAGKYSYIRKEKGKLVLADLKGPGVINRIWTPTPTKDTLEFYFDGEKKPRLRICFEDLFSGKVQPFVRPLCANEVGGFYCYFPFTYRKSCKIMFTGDRIQFHQIQYRDLKGKDVRSYTPQDNAECASIVDEIVRRWSDINPAPADYMTGRSAGSCMKSDSFVLNPGEEHVFFEDADGGRITAIEIESGSGLEGLERDVLLQARWDDDEDYAINAPAADFFGYAFGKAAMRGFLIGSARGRNYSFLPAPYDSKAVMKLRYEKRSGSDQAPIRFNCRVYCNDTPRNASEEGKLYTCWRRDMNPQKGRHYDFLDYKGKGHYVGTVHLAQGLVPKMTEFFEGDDSTYVDGAMRIHGTGSEDYYNGGWYALLDRWDRGASMPLHGALDYSLQMSRTGGYRFYLNDKLSFENEIYMGIEHGPSGNEFPVDYTSVAYYYGEKPASCSVAPDETLREVYIPKMHPFFPQAMMITMGNNVKTQFIYSGIRCWADGNGLVRVMLDGLTEGRYRIYLDYCEKPDGAEFSIWQRQKMIMDWKSTQAEKYNWVDKMYCGEMELTSQNNSLSFLFKGEKYSRELEFAIIYLENVED